MKTKTLIAIGAFVGVFAFHGTVQAQEAYTRAPSPTGNAVQVQNPIDISYEFLLTESIADSCSMPGYNAVFVVAQTSSSQNFVMGGQVTTLEPIDVGVSISDTILKDLADGTIVYDLRLLCTFDNNLTIDGTEIDVIEDTFEIFTFEADNTGLFTVVETIVTPPTPTTTPTIGAVSEETDAMIFYFLATMLFVVSFFFFTRVFNLFTT